MAPKLGTGARFRKLTGELAASGASDPGALAAYIGRRKYGAGKFGKLAARGARKAADREPDGRDRESRGK